MTAAPTRRWLVGLLVALWSSEWLFTWSAALGELGAPVGWLWFAGFVILVARSLSRTRTPELALVWAWTLAILGVAMFHAWWLARSGPLPLVPRDQLELLLGEFPIAIHPEFRALARLLDLVGTPLLVGLAAGLVAGVELLVVGLGVALGRTQRDEPPARVGLLARVAVTALQLPTLLAIPALGVALLAGVVACLVAPVPPPPVDPGVPIDAAAAAMLVELRAATWQLVLLGAALWVLGVVHLRRLLALRRGGRGTTLALGLFAALPGLAILVGAAPPLGLAAVIVAWIALQLLALGLARPRRADAPG